MRASLERSSGRETRMAYRRRNVTALSFVNLFSSIDEHLVGKSTPFDRARKHRARTFDGATRLYKHYNVQFH